MEDKVFGLGDLARRADALRREGKRIVLCHGMFDLVHPGHVRHLKRAREEGDVLIVTITADGHARKGPGRPVFTEALRAENLAALVFVDYVGVVDAPSAVDAITTIRPDVYVKGSDYRDAENDVTGEIVAEREAVEAHGGRVFFTDEITFSSSALLNRHFDIFPLETRAYLEDLRAAYSADAIVEMLKSLADLRVLVLGEAIIDRYTYTSILGQTGKGPFMSVRHDYSEDYAGGAMAVANHIAAFAGEVVLASNLGGNNAGGADYEAFVRSHLLDNVSPELFVFEAAKTIVKERFVDQELTKYFEVYHFEEEPRASAEEEARVCDWLERRVRGFDAAVVPDYGNSFITAPMIDVLCRKAHFLAVNTQINSGNRGYHVVSRYPRADFIALNEPELRLATHNRHDPVERLAAEIAERLECKVISITQGPKGVLTVDRARETTHRIPGLAAKVVDRVGAGDAFLSLASISLAKGLPEAVAIFAGAAAAALDIQIVGNRETVDAASLCKYVEVLLK